MGRTKKTITAEEACLLLGDMPFGNWRARMWAYHRGVPAKRWNPEDGERPRRTGPWMPTPVNGGYSSRRATFKLKDILYLYSEWFGVAWEDSADSVEEFDANERNRLHAACSFFGISAPERRDDPVDLDTARRVFKKEALQSHPDRFMHDPVEQQKAQDRFVSLNVRFQLLAEHNERIGAALAS